MLAERLLFLNQKALDVLEKPKLRWLESVEEDLKNMGMRNWRRKLQVQEHWRTILEEPEVHKGL